MIVIDIGNTNIVIGIYLNSKLTNVYRFDTKIKRSIEKIKKIINKKKILEYEINNKLCCISSVVPEIDWAISGPVPKNPLKDLTGPLNVVLAIIFSPL